MQVPICTASRWQSPEQLRGSSVPSTRATPTSGKIGSTVGAVVAQLADLLAPDGREIANETGSAIDGSKADLAFELSVGRFGAGAIDGIPVIDHEAMQSAGAAGDRVAARIAGNGARRQ